MDTGSALLILGGLVLLVGGGEVLVRGAGDLAGALGMSPMLVGLTVVAFATSAPELAVSLQAALTDNAGLAVGNVIGSNIANVMLVLGLSAAVAPLVVAASIVRRDVPIVGAVSVLALLLALDHRYGRLDGVLLFGVLVAYITFTVVGARRAERDPLPEGGGSPVADPEPATRQRSGGAMGRNGVLIAVGVGLLLLGANWLVDGATQIARSWGVSDLIIGLTVVAIGTSLPELATSIIASMRGQRDMAVGNVLGSCLFNLGAVLGVVAIISGDVPVEPAAVYFDLPVMVAAALALLPIAFTGLAIARWEGLLFLAYYVAYLTYLVLNATEHDNLSAFSAVMASVVIPITVVTLAVLTIGELRLRRSRAPV